MYRNERTRNIILIVLAVCLIGITVAYATLSQNLKISGVANVDKTTEVSTKKVTEPFTMLLLGVDSPTEDISKVSGLGDSVSYDKGNGVRPAIEVLKTNIKY